MALKLTEQLLSEGTNLTYDVKPDVTDLFEYSLVKSSSETIYSEFYRFIDDEINYYDEETGEYTGTLHDVISTPEELTYQILCVTPKGNGPWAAYENEDIADLGYSFKKEDINNATARYATIFIPNSVYDKYSFTFKQGDSEVSMTEKTNISYSGMTGHLFYYSAKNQTRILGADSQSLPITIMWEEK